LRSIKDKESVSEVIKKLQLGAYENRLTKNLSLGNAQRLGLAKALIHNPEILILDEPANGLDPAGIYEIREMLIDLAENHGVTIIVSSHILNEISRFATRIGIIHEGKLLQEINTNQLEKLCDKRLLVNANDIEKAKVILTQNNFSIEPTNNNLIEIKSSLAINKPDFIATLLVNSDCPPTLLQVVEEDLESYFFKTIETKEAIK
jgi:ABC-2 type transport system ATP-binding protein